MHLQDLSIVIPIDFHRRSWDLYRRVQRFVVSFSNQPVQLIFGCNSAPQFWVNCLQRLIATHTNMHICLVDAEASSLSTLRNTALDAVNTQYVLFLDIDIVPDLQLVQLAYEQVLSQPKHVAMFPCLYLSKSGSKLISKYIATEFKDYYFDFRRDLILHLAFPSSIIITDVASVREIGGFDEQFIGHGYEDFDFMLRLFHHKDLIEYTADILVDEPYLAPLMSVGLRAVLAKPFLESLIQPVYFLHKFHKKDRNEDYYKDRFKNQIIFFEKFKTLIPYPKKTYKNQQYLINNFMKLLKNKNLIHKEYSALWAEIPSHLFRIKK